MAHFEFPDIVYRQKERLDQVKHIELDDPFVTPAETRSNPALSKPRRNRTAHDVLRRRRKRMREETDDSDDVDIRVVNSIRRSRGVREIMTRQPGNKPSMLEELPAELLELVAWFSLSSTLPLTSKKIFEKLGHLKELRRDMALLVFCNWDEVHKGINRENFPSRNLLVDTSKLPLQSPVARSSTPPTFNMIDLHTLRNIFGEMAWCNRPFLEMLVDTVMSTWWDYTFDPSEIQPISKLRFANHYQQIGDDIRTIYLHTNDLTHRLVLRAPYEVSIVCSNGINTPPCPHCGTGACPKNLGFRTTDQFPTFPRQKIFALPRVPESVLLGSNNRTKEQDMQFYQKGIDSSDGSVVKISPDWIGRLQFRHPVKIAMANAIRDKRYDILRRVLYETARSEPSKSIYNRARPKPDEQIAGQQMMAALAYTHQWRGLMDISTNLERRNGFSGSPTKLGLEAADKPLRAIILTHAGEAAEEDDSDMPLKVMEWWVKDSMDLVPDSWRKHSENELTGSIVAANEHALQEANRAVAEKISHIQKKVKVAEAQAET